MTRTAIYLAYFCFLRVGEYCYTHAKPSDGDYTRQSDNDHCLRAADVTFLCYNGTTVSAPAAADHPFRTYQAVQIQLPHRKNKPNGTEPSTFVFPADGGTDINLCNILYKWTCNARLKPTSPFLSYRPQNGNRVVHLSSTWVTNALRAGATKFGIDPQRVTPHSLRISASTQARSAGVSDHTVFRIGGWAAINSTSCLWYQKTTESEFRHLYRALCDRSTFTIRDLKYVLPTTTTSTFHSTGAPL